MPEVKELIDELRTQWEQFKASNDARLAEIDKNGKASAETNAKVDRLNDAIASMQATLTQRVDDMETRLNRPNAGGNGGLRPSDAQLRMYARWQSVAQQRDVDPGQVDLKLIQDYNRAFRDWMRRGDRASADNLRMLNEMSVASSPDGGFLVSPDTDGRIATLITESSPIRRLAAVQQISSDSLEGVNDLDDAGAAWVGETATRSGNTDTPQVGIWKIPVHEQYSEPNTTQKMLDDAQVDVESWLAGKVSTAFSIGENTAFVSGNGVLRPRGFTTYANGTPSATTWNVIQQVVSGHATLLTADGLINLVFALKSAYRRGSVFGMNRLTESAVRKLKDGVGNYLWQPDFQMQASATLLGFPIEEMADLANVGASALPVVFGNFRIGYQVVDRGGIRVLRDPYTRKGYVKFYTTKRVGGDVVNFEALKLQVVSA